jgi:hypothetical protein
MLGEMGHQHGPMDVNGVSPMVGRPDRGQRPDHSINVLCIEIHSGWCLQTMDFYDFP